GPPLRADAGSGFPSAVRATQLACRRNDRLPLRGCSLFAAAGPSIVARGEIALALRDGAVPGQSMRTSGTVSFSVESGFGAASGISGARGEFGESGSWFVNPSLNYAHVPQSVAATLLRLNLVVDVFHDSLQRFRQRLALRLGTFE